MLAETALHPVMLNGARFPFCHASAKRSIQHLTLFWRCQNVPLLLQGEGPEGEVCYPHPIMPQRSEASMRWIPRSGRNDRQRAFGMSKKVRRTSMFYSTMTKDKCGTVLQNLHIHSSTRPKFCMHFTYRFERDFSFPSILCYLHAVFSIT